MKGSMLAVALISFQVHAQVSTNNKAFIEAESLETIESQALINVATNIPIEMMEVLSEYVDMTEV